MKPKTKFGEKQNTNGFDKHPENINRKGHPVGVKNRSTILKKWIEISTKITDPETQKISEGTMEDKVILALLKKAGEGDIPAIKEINDTLYGKIADKGEVKVDSQIQFNINFCDYKQDDQSIPETENSDEPITGQ